MIAPCTVTYSDLKNNIIHLELIELNPLVVIPSVEEDK